MASTRKLQVRVIEQDRWPEPGDDLAHLTPSERIALVFEVSARAYEAAGHGERRSQRHLVRVFWSEG